MRPETAPRTVGPRGPLRCDGDVVVPARRRHGVDDGARAVRARDAPRRAGPPRVDGDRGVRADASPEARARESSGAGRGGPPQGGGVAPGWGSGGKAPVGGPPKGGGSAPLGKTTKSAATSDINDLPARELSRPVSCVDSGWYELREPLRDLSGSRRRACCDRWAKAPEVGPGGWLGVMHCESVWSCPPCAKREWARRCRELGAVVKLARERGARLAFVTATVRHAPGDTLESVGDAVQGAWRAICAHRSFKGATVGAVRRVEVTVGRHGWHPHIHAVVVLEKGYTLDDLKGLSELWRGIVRDLAPAHSPNLHAGWHVREVRDRGGGRYLGDALGAELTDPASEKWGREEGAHSLLALARAAARGDERARALWAEFARWSHGRRALCYSRHLSRLRDHVEPEDGATCEWTGVVDPESWRAVRSVPWGLRAVQMGLAALWPRPPPES